MKTSNSREAIRKIKLEKPPEQENKRSQWERAKAHADDAAMFQKLLDWAPKTESLPVESPNSERVLSGNLREPLLFFQKLVLNLLTHQTPPSLPEHFLDSMSAKSLECRVLSGPLEGLVIAYQKTKDSLRFTLRTGKKRLCKELKKLEPEIKMQLSQYFIGLTLKVEIHDA